MLKLILAIYGLTQCYSIGVRRSSHTLSDDEKAEFLDALYLMKSTPSSYDPTYNAYDFFIYVHLLANDPFTTYGHGSWSFLPWHRIFLFLFEEEMQLVTNNTNLYLPYWNPTNETESEILLNDYTFLGGNGISEFPYILPNTSTLSCDKWPILPSLNGRADLYDYTCLHRQIGEGVPARNWNNTNTTKYLYKELLPKSLWDDVIMTYRVYDVYPYNSASDNFTIEDHESSFRSMLEGCTKWNDDGTLNADLVFLTKLGACQGLHGHLHGHVGGQLASLASPNDPLFFMLHNWVDLMWSRYQYKYGDELSAIPEEFLDIDVTQGKFPENDLLTTSQVLDHETQLGYIYDYDYDLDLEDDTSSTTMMGEDDMTSTTMMGDDKSSVGMNEVHGIIMYLVVIYCVFFW